MKKHEKYGEQIRWRRGKGEKLWDKFENDEEKGSFIKILVESKFRMAGSDTYL